MILQLQQRQEQEAQKQRMMMLQDQQERLARVHSTAQKKPRNRGLNPNNKKQLMGRNKSTKLFENDRTPLPVENDTDKPGPHMPKYKQYELKRN